MPFNIFKSSFPKWTIEQLHGTKNNNVLLRTYDNSNIERLGICAVKLRHKNNVTKCRFIVVSDNDPVLLMDIEVIDILQITCEVLDDKQAGRKFDSQIT